MTNADIYIYRIAQEFEVNNESKLRNSRLTIKSVKNSHKYSQNILEKDLYY